jgi:hypothetical protein
MTKTWIVGGALVLVAVFLTVWWYSPRVYETPMAPEGQFPLEEQPQVQWPGVIKSLPYSPMNGNTDQDLLLDNGETVDEKRICGRRLYDENS